MVVLIARRSGYSRGARHLDRGIYCAYLAGNDGRGIFLYDRLQVEPSGKLIRATASKEILRNVSTQAYYAFTFDSGFLLLILIGAFLARRHGRLALLLPLGYLIPTVVFGRFAYDRRTAVPAGLPQRHRVRLSCAGFPDRTGLDRPLRHRPRPETRRHRRIAGRGRNPARGKHRLLNYRHRQPTAWTAQALNIYYSISPELIMLAGVGLAVSLYKPGVSAGRKPG